jgi:hypothetical protein
VQREEIDPRYIIRPYYLRPDGKVGHDAFAVIRETVRDMPAGSTSSRSSRWTGGLWKRRWSTKVSHPDP